MADKLIGRGQYTLVSLHDGKLMQAYLRTNLSAIQFFSRAKNEFSPDYTVQHLIITPELYFSGSVKNQIKYLKHPVWEINGQPPINFGGVASKRSPYSLSIAKNMTNANQLYVTFRGTVVDPDTSLEVSIASNICISRHEEANVTPVLMLEYPNGSIFKNDIYESLSASSKLKIGSHDMSNYADYTWYKLEDSRYTKVVDSLGIYGQGTNTITVLSGYIKGQLQFKCSVEYNGATYVDYVTFATQVDPYVCKIENKNGDKMHNGSGVILCEAHIYQGDTKIPDDKAEQMFEFRWIKHNRATGEEDKSWGKVARKIELNKNDIDKLSTFVCEVNRKNDDQSFPYKLPFVLQ